MRSATAQQMAVAVLRHPAGARQMAFPGASRPGRLGCWIDVQHKLRDFLPICSVGLGVQQAKVGYEVLLVITGEGAVRRRRVCNGWIERWSLHQWRIHRSRSVSMSC